MNKSVLVALVVGLMIFGIAAVQAAPPLSPKAQVWIKQEAEREMVSNKVSESTALQAARNAQSGINFAGMDVSEIAAMIMMECSNKADKDMREILADMKKTNAQKQTQRQAIEKQKVAQASVKSQLREEYSKQQTQPRIARSAALDSYLASQNVTYDSLGDLSEEQQLKMQMLMDRRLKANEAASNIMKKSSDTSSGIIGNMK
jgi:hypothetical protein